MSANSAPVDGKRSCAKCGQARPLHDFSPGRTDCRACRVELNQVNRWRRTFELEYLRALTRALLPSALLPAPARRTASRRIPVGESR